MNQPLDALPVLSCCRMPLQTGPVDSNHHFLLPACSAIVISHWSSNCELTLQLQPAAPSVCCVCVPALRGTFMPGSWGSYANIVCAGP